MDGSCSALFVLRIEPVCGGIDYIERGIRDPDHCVRDIARERVFPQRHDDVESQIDQLERHLVLGRPARASGLRNA
jgi:hypothetical protein